jgi:hypothetical protein
MTTKKQTTATAKANAGPLHYGGKSAAFDRDDGRFGFGQGGRLECGQD